MYAVTEQTDDGSLHTRNYCNRFHVALHVLTEYGAEVTQWGSKTLQQSYGVVLSLLMKFYALVEKEWDEQRKKQEKAS